MRFSASQTGPALATLTVPTYDEQIGTTFTQNLGAVTYNVTALAQTDADGYGPAYILNGLTNAGYWYQVGISYHWPSVGGGYNAGFAFSYQVYAADGRSAYPASGSGLGTFSKAVHSGDSMLLSLTFIGTAVQMLAQDWQTGAVAKTSFSSEGASSFVGNPSNPSSNQGYFTGIMTEWYHVGEYTGSEGKVTYTNTAVALNSAWLWADEFQAGSTGGDVFSNRTQTPVTFTNAQQLYPFVSNGAAVYGSAHQIITGLLNSAASRVTLVPATPSTGAASFLATYTLAGLKQTSALEGGNTSLIEADPGTTVTLYVNSSGSSPLMNWVLSGTSGTSVTFAAGANVTYVYYELVEETVSVGAASGGSLPSFPTLTYEVPAQIAGSQPLSVPVSQLLGTSPVSIFTMVGSSASVTASVSGASSGERWGTAIQNWTILSSPNTIPSPILYYHQYVITLLYMTVGGGTPPEAPRFTSNAFGVAATAQLNNVSQSSVCPSQLCSPSTPILTSSGWFDAGSFGSFTSLLNGSNPAERWSLSNIRPNNVSGVITTPLMVLVSTPGEVVTGVYTHQYYVSYGVNDPDGGTISASSGWFDAGNRVNVTATANQGWQLEGWNGTGYAVYTGGNPPLIVGGPFSLNATFYAGLSISADKGTNIAYSYGSESGTVQAGTDKTVYVAPSSSVSFKATPSDFLHSFASWKGTGLANATKPSLALTVNQPTSIAGTSTYNLIVLVGGLAGAAVILALSGFLWIRNKQNRANPGGYAA